jgi:hypothetical protein
VVSCFAEYWKTSPEDLITSFDAFNYYLAASIKQASKCWGHTDHGAYSDHEPLDGLCLQGLLNIEDCTGDNDGGLVVWDKAHRAWKGYFQKNPSSKTEGNWFKYPTEYLEEISQDGRKYLQPSDPDAKKAEPLPMVRTRVRAPAGAMVFWYSKTPHQNDAPFRRVPNVPLGRDRVAVYASMAPKRYQTQNDIKKRKTAFFENRQTSHWPGGDQTKLFPQSFRTYSSEKYQIQKGKLAKLKNHKVWTKKAKLTKLGESLLGFSLADAPAARKRQTTLFGGKVTKKSVKKSS